MIYEVILPFIYSADAMFVCYNIDAQAGTKHRAEVFEAVRGVDSEAFPLSVTSEYFPACSSMVVLHKALLLSEKLLGDLPIFLEHLNFGDLHVNLHISVCTTSAHITP